MNLQMLLIHSLWFLMAVIFVGNSHAEEVPVQEADGHVAILGQEATPPQQYVAGTHEGSGTSNPSAEVLEKLEALQSQLQKLQGKIEVSGHDIGVLRAQNQALYRDLDARLTKLEKHGIPPKPVISAPATEAKTDTNGDEFYQAAYDMLQHKQYPQATRSFQAFIAHYPKSHYAANAHYWLGELYLSQGFIDKAKQEFQLVVTQYPQAGKVPAAMLKLGFAYYDNGEWQQARNTLNQVQQRYPDTDPARMAASRIRDMDQQGL
jgi:tol-pal system protein YbgF